MREGGPVVESVVVAESQGRIRNRIIICRGEGIQKTPMVLKKTHNEKLILEQIAPASFLLLNMLVLYS